MSLTVNNDTNMSERQIVTFHLGNDEFGANIMNVKEIVRISDITKVPNAPDYIEGVCNLRGSVLPIIDGRTRMNMLKKDKDESSRVLVIDTGGKSTGMIVDRVSEVMRISSADIEAPPSIIKSLDSDYLSGVVKLDNGNRLIMLLEMSKVLSIEEAEKETGKSLTEETQKTLTENYENKEITIEEQLVSFLLGKEEYALNIMHVKEIIRFTEIVEMPNAESYIEGVVSIRNHLLPIINMRKYFGMEAQEVTDHTRILVVDMGEITAGILVDKVSEVIRVHSEVIQPPPPVFSGGNDEQLKGIAKLNNGKRILLILDPYKFIESESIQKISDAKKSDVAKEEGNRSLEKQITEEEQLVTFRIDNEEFGIKITDVQEINRMTDITKIPKAPFFIEGIVNLRGNIIPAMNLRKLFGLSDKEYTDSTRVIIVDLHGKKTGIIVDAVSEVLRFEKSLIEEPPKILKSDIDEEFIEGVAKLKEGKRMILIVNLEMVLSYYQAEQQPAEPEVVVKRNKNEKKSVVEKSSKSKKK